MRRLHLWFKFTKASITFLMLDILKSREKHHIYNDLLNEISYMIIIVIRGTVL